MAAQIAEALPGSSHEYREWIQTYASEDYLELPAKHEHLIDTLGPAQPYGAQFQAVFPSIFDQASEGLSSCYLLRTGLNRRHALLLCSASCRSSGVQPIDTPLLSSQWCS